MLAPTMCASTCRSYDKARVRHHPDGGRAQACRHASSSPRRTSRLRASCRSFGKHLKDIFPGVGGEERSDGSASGPPARYRPAIGRAPRLVNVYCGYGTAFRLTLATATGRLIARMMAGILL